MRYRIVFLACGLSLLVGCNSVSEVAGPITTRTTIAITNKISSLPAGESYVFNVDEENDQSFTVSLKGPGTFVVTGKTATYIAPASVPSPATVTVNVLAANSSHITAADSDTFSITGAPGPVVSISPSAFATTDQGGGGGKPLTLLHLTVTQDSAADVLTPSVSSSPDCGGACGYFGAINGTPGSGAYTVEYYPPLVVAGSTQQFIYVSSSLPGATQGVSVVSITNYWGY